MSDEGTAANDLRRLRDEQLGSTAKVAVSYRPFPSRIRGIEERIVE